MTDNQRIIILEYVVRSLMDVISQTATPEQLENLSFIGREANKIQDKFREQK
jgi:hypothetical protein